MKVPVMVYPHTDIGSFSTPNVVISQLPPNGDNFQGNEQTNIFLHTMGLPHIWTKPQESLDKANVLCREIKDRVYNDTVHVSSSLSLLASQIHDSSYLNDPNEIDIDDEFDKSLDATISVAKDIMTRNMNSPQYELHLEVRDENEIDLDDLDDEPEKFSIDPNEINLDS